MAGMVGQKTDGKEPDGAGAVGQGGSNSWEGMVGCMRARWQLLGILGWHGAGVQDGGQAGT